MKKYLPRVFKFYQPKATGGGFFIFEWTLISILLISPPKVIYAELFCVKDTPHFFPNLFQNHPVCLIEMT
jgi:hypothetical protein